MKRKPQPWTLAALGALLLAGFFLRVHALGRQSLWVDEAYTWGVVARTSWRDVWAAMLAVSDVSPLAYVIAKLGAPLFGVTEFGLRLTGALAGWLAIPVVYRLGRAMMGGRVGALAAAIVAVSPFAVWYSQDARPYGLYLLLSALALWGFWRARGGRGWALFIASSAALYLTHYVAALFVYAQAAYILTQLRRSPKLLRQWAGAQAVAVLPVAAWVAAFLAQRQLLTSLSWIPPVTILTPLQTLWNFASGDAARWSLPMIAGVLVLLALMALGARTHRTARALLLWWLILPLLAAWLFSLRRPAYVDRYFLPGLLTVALLLAAGLLRLPRLWRVAGTALTLAGLLIASTRLYTDPQFAKEDWRGAAAAIQADGLKVGVPDVESALGLTPYIAPQVKFSFARNAAELSARLAEGPFVLILRSPHESAHALTESVPFEPLTEGPGFFLQWRAAHAGVPLSVRRFTGLALVVVGK
nr:glycosyltransferase family 39 protein [Chloroflexota bacterium]